VIDRLLAEWRRQAADLTLRDAIFGALMSGVVVDQEGKASLVRADQLDMYGAYETEEDREPK